MPHFKKEMFGRFAKMMTRKKEFVYQEETELKRVLSILDLTFLGIGSMVGMGVYIMVGDLATKVGPACVISFLLAGFACALSGVCYAEFAARVPCTGSAYAYSYITVGELVAFILGWNIVLESIIGTACLARGMSGYVDSLLGGHIETFLSDHFSWNNPSIAPYPDFFAFALMILFSAIVCAGVKESTTLNNIFVTVNLLTVTAIVIIGIFRSNTSNWALPPTSEGGNGGFVPFGVSKIMEGAATCFYAYSGFDTVATTGNEAKNPRKSIPIALVSSILSAASIYMALSLTFTLMWPYYDPELAGGHPYPYIFSQLGMNWAKYLVGIGATCAVFGCLLSSVFGMSRIIYAIANDGLIFDSLSKINTTTRTPVKATIISGIVTGIIAIIFTTEQLVDMTSLGTLMAYTMVAICVLILRYEDPEMESIQQYNSRNFGSHHLQKVFNVPVSKSTAPNQLTSSIVKASTVLAVTLSVVIGCIVAFYSDALVHEPIVMIVAVLLSIVFVSLVIVIGRQPQSSAQLSFKVYPVPYIPLICTFFNVYLMLKLNQKTWIRFFVWLIIGLIIYFGYGIWHSKQPLSPEKKKRSIDDDDIKEEL